jgi:hypothetical protein
MSEKSIIFSGLPESGKTTFLAALWFYIFNSSHENEYTCDSLEGVELEYLNAISTKWASCEEVIRTNQNKIEEVTINLKNRLSDKPMRLWIPDMRGETFNTQFEHREWDEEFDIILDKAYGMLLFVDPRDVKNKPRLIFKENQPYKCFGEELINTDPEQAWSEDLAPSQVKLVDFLQMIDFHKPNILRKISVIVSCWDEIKTEVAPEIWCKKEVPLLYQYLSSNLDLFDVKYFGVSAQGGSYEKTETKDSLLELDDPLERIKVTDGKFTTNNIFSPILWITDDNTD